MNPLAAKLGLSKDLAFYDIYSFTDPDLLALIPRPVHALLVIIPTTPVWVESRAKEDADKEEYTGSGPDGSSHNFLYKIQESSFYRPRSKLTSGRTGGLVQADNRSRLRLHWPPPQRHQWISKILYPTGLNVREDPQRRNPPQDGG